MTTTDSQNFKEIQESDVHHMVTLEVDFPKAVTIELAGKTTGKDLHIKLKLELFLVEI